MAVEFLVKARAKKSLMKGAIGQTIKEAPAVWGLKERLPDYIIVRVTDVDIADKVIENYNKPWVERFIVRETASKIIIERADEGRVNRIALTTEKIQKAKQALAVWGVTAENVTKVSGNIHIDKVLPVAEVQRIVTDILEEPYKHRQFYVDPVRVDQFVAIGNDLVEVTLQQLKNNLIDGLD